MDCVIKGYSFNTDLQSVKQRVREDEGGGCVQVGLLMLLTVPLTP
jgi:hypothetical protein